jgi:hypothetical protein
MPTSFLNKRLNIVIVYCRIVLCHSFNNKYKTFSVLIYSYINTSGNWENEKVCGNTTPRGRSAFTQFRVSPISTSVDIFINTEKCFIFFYNIAQRNIKKEIFRVDIELISTRLLANQRSEFTKAILAIKTSTLKIRRCSL